MLSVSRCWSKQMCVRPLAPSLPASGWTDIYLLQQPDSDTESIADLFREATGSGPVVSFGKKSRAVRLAPLDSRCNAGTTWHSAGLLWRLRPNDTDIQLIGKTHSVLQEIEAETGIDPG